MEYDLGRRLARFYTDAQELLVRDPEVQQLRRLWQEASDFSNFMDTLRTEPGRATGTQHRSHSLHQLTNYPPPPKGYAWRPYVQRAVCPCKNSSPASPPV